MLRKRRQQTFGETGGKQSRPESISRARKMMAHGRGVQTRIDAAKKHLQPGRNNVGYRLIGGGGKLGLGWFPGLSQMTGVLVLLDFKTRLLRLALF